MPREFELKTHSRWLVAVRGSRILSGLHAVTQHRHPLLTPARKVRLYSIWEHLGFLFRVATNREATFRNRAACYAWYDGRR
jgi:hypothetical protein